jgi:hypothetical protein
MPDRPSIPRYGDEIMIPSGYPDKHWCNGIVNSGYQHTFHRNGLMLVMAPGHAKSNVILVPEGGYKKDWCWPEDIGVKAGGSKASSLEDVVG